MRLAFAPFAVGSIPIHPVWLVIVFVMSSAVLLRADEAKRIPRFAISFRTAEPILVAGEPIQVKGRAATRCADWEQDGDLDLLVGAGDGRLWLFQNDGSKQEPRFLPAQAIQAGNRTTWGTEKTSLQLADLVGNDLPDLVVAHSNRMVTIHENLGTPQKPRFREEAVETMVSNQTHGRLDVADWDGDGRLDLITGSFVGELGWQAHVGQPREPKFGPFQPLTLPSLPYNAHPRVWDLNQDRFPDLLVGQNWGTAICFLRKASSADRSSTSHAADVNRAGSQAADASQPSASDTGRGGNAPQASIADPRHFDQKVPAAFGKGISLYCADDGKPLDIRRLNGDDLTPELADLDGDGVFDLISGGVNGRLFWMRGVSSQSDADEVRTMLKKYRESDSKQHVTSSQRLVEVLNKLKFLQATANANLLSVEEKGMLIAKLEHLSLEYPELLQRAAFDLRQQPLAPLVAAQYWLVMSNLTNADRGERERLADRWGFQGGYRPLWIDLGVILVDNNQAKPEQLEAMHRLLVSFPPAIWDVELITVAGWLGPAIKTHSLAARTAVNIFAMPLGQIENSFPADAPRTGETDTFLICLAHEIAHNMLDTVGRQIRPALYEYKFEGLAQAAGPLVAFRKPASAGIDVPSTQARFREAGHWDGNDATWAESFKRYFQQPGVFGKVHVRGNIHFFLESPQEAFATLSNQFCTDSQLMLELCHARWEAGYPSNINQFMLIADYLSADTNQLSFYRLRPGGSLTVEPATIERDMRGRITRLQSRKTIAHFGYETGNLVKTFRIE
jgi:hypothetical protein